MCLVETVGLNKQKAMSRPHSRPPRVLGSQVLNEAAYTFTISEPSISFNLERQPVILSGWVLHFNRSSISPFQTEKED